MKTQRTRHSKKQNSFWIVTGLMLSGLLGAASVSLAAQGVWTEKAPMPTARLGLATAAANGKIYAIGGYAGANAPGLPTVEEYDPITDTWTRKADMPTGRRWLSASCVDGKIYAIGGQVTVGAPGLKTVEEYDPVTNSWTTKADMPAARAWLSTAVVDGKVFAIGGASSPVAPVLAVGVYDPVTDTWIEKADMSSRRAFFSTSVVDGKIYAIGEVTPVTPPLSIVEMYDPISDIWTPKTDMPTARGGLSTSVVNGIVYAIGGQTGGPVVSAVESYDPVTDTWNAEADMPMAIWALSTSVVDGKIYVIGGSETVGPPHPGVTTVYEYDPNPLVVDFNGDGIVDCVDMCMMVEHWHTDEPFYDIAPPPHGDGIVDIQDLILLSEHLYEEILPPELVAYWKLDETEGDIAYDSAYGSAGENDAVVFGDAIWQPTAGQIDGALQLDGIDDYVSVDLMLERADAKFSVFAWIKGGMPGQVVFSQVGTSDWLGADTTNGSLMTELRFLGKSIRPLHSEAVITDGSWHRIGLVWDGSNRILYVDDVEVASDTYDKGWLIGGLQIGAGKNLELSSFFSGLIDDVRIYDRAVTP
ncbi:MAG: kelch repeat-containing protein [Planctomycetota bacterium]|jgi:N-acetylneuraminic acid mutarotase